MIKLAAYESIASILNTLSVLKYFLLHCGACNLPFAVSKIFSLSVLKKLTLSSVVTQRQTSTIFQIYFPPGIALSQVWY